MCVKTWSHEQTQSSRETATDKGSVKAMVEVKDALRTLCLRPRSSSTILLPFLYTEFPLFSPKAFHSSCLLRGSPVSGALTSSSFLREPVISLAVLLACPSLHSDSQWKRSISKEFSVFQEMILDLPFFCLLQTFIIFVLWKNLRCAVLYYSGSSKWQDIHFPCFLHVPSQTVVFSPARGAEVHKSLDPTSTSNDYLRKYLS